jgi:phosphoglycerol transferase MdoB-like AlkP superfamily enzyme
MGSVAFFWWLMSHSSSRKELKSPHWLAALVSYFFFICAVFLFLLSFAGSDSSAPHSHRLLRLAFLVTSIGLFVAGLVVHGKFVDRSRIRWVRNKKVRKPLKHVRKTGSRG